MGYRGQLLSPYLFGECIDLGQYLHSWGYLFHSCRKIPFTWTRMVTGGGLWSRSLTRRRINSRAQQSNYELGLRSQSARPLFESRSTFNSWATWASYCTFPTLSFLTCRNGGKGTWRALKEIACVKGRYTAWSSARTQLLLIIMIVIYARAFPWETDIHGDRDTVMCPSDSILFSTLALKTIQEVRLESDDWILANGMWAEMRYINHIPAWFFKDLDLCFFSPSFAQLKMKDPKMAEPQDGRNSDPQVSAWRWHDKESCPTSIEIGESKI